MNTYLDGPTFFLQSNLLGHLDNLSLVISTNQAGEIISVMLRNISKLYILLCVVQTMIMKMAYDDDFLATNGGSCFYY